MMLSDQNLALAEHKAGTFDYESKVWGGHEVKVTPTYLGALRLRYCLEDLRGIYGRVLEVGCGAGGMARGIKAYRPDFKVYGCDISRGAVQVANGKEGDVTYGVSNAYDLPFASNDFSAVVMFDLLEHLEDPKRSIEEVWRILEPEGRFHLFVPCEGGLNTLHGLLTRIGWRAKEYYGGHIQSYTFSELKSLLKIAGFKVRNFRWSGHLVNQAVDVTYFSGLSILGRNVPMSVEGYLESTRPNFFTATVGMLKSLIAVASYYESKYLSWLPGSGIHLLCNKECEN